MQGKNIKKWLVNAYRQAPWRNQVQSLGMYLLILVVLLVVAGVYLNISGQAASAGMETQLLTNERQALERQIADKKAQLAEATSVTIMQKRATELGYKRIDPDEAFYIAIPEYPGRQIAIQSPPPSVEKTPASIVKNTYRQSLWDWLFQGISTLNETMQESQP